MSFHLAPQKDAAGFFLIFCGEQNGVALLVMHNTA